MPSVKPSNAPEKERKLQIVLTKPRSNTSLAGKRNDDQGSVAATKSAEQTQPQISNKPQPTERLPAILSTVNPDTVNNRSILPTTATMARLLTQQQHNSTSALPDCDQRQHTSAIRKCTIDSDKFWRQQQRSPQQGRFAKAINYLNTSDSFVRDMTRRDTLVRRQEELYTMIAATGSESEFVRSQRLELAGKIAHIDKKYSAVDLIKVAQKIVKRVQENAGQ